MNRFGYRLLLKTIMLRTFQTPRIVLSHRFSFLRELFSLRFSFKTFYRNVAYKFKKIIENPNFCDLQLFQQGTIGYSFKHYTADDMPMYV